MNTPSTSLLVPGHSSLRRVVAPLVAVASLLVLADHQASAQTITGPTTDTQVPAGTTINLSASNAFGYYPNATGAAVTDSQNVGMLTAVTGVSGTGQSAFLTVNYTNGSGGTNTGTGFDYTYGALALSSTLFAANETYNFYFADYQGSIRLTATLETASGTQLSQYAQTYPSFNTGGNSAATVALSVVNGISGDLVVISVARGNGTGNIGLQAITATGVPEPSADALLGFGGVAALFGRRVSRANLLLRRKPFGQLGEPVCKVRCA